jgi:hypothetical protein
MVIFFGEIMDNTNHIIDIYTHFGAVGIFVLILTVVIISQFSDFGKRINKIIVEKIFGKKRGLKISFDSFVRKLEHMRDYNIKKINIKCLKRREVFRDFATNRVNNLILFIKSLKDIDFSKFNNEELFFFFTENIFKIKEASSQEVIGMGIPKEVIERMKVIENDEVKIFNNLVANICASNSDYISNNEKVAVIIDFLCALSGVSIVNAENAVDSLNGQLDDLVYKGHSCDNCNISDCAKRRKNV